MEHDYRVSPLSRLFEARHELRQYILLETALIERTDQLPEDDFCHIARESFQLGAGYAYLQRETDDISLETVFEAYFATQPRNKYPDPEVVTLEKKVISEAAMRLLETGKIPELESHIDIYQVEASAAFAEGYSITASMLVHEIDQTDVA